MRNFIYRAVSALGVVAAVTAVFLLCYGVPDTTGAGVVGPLTVAAALVCYFGWLSAARVQTYTRNLSWAHTLVFGLVIVMLAAIYVLQDRHLDHATVELVRVCFFFTVAVAAVIWVPSALRLAFFKD